VSVSVSVLLGLSPVFLSYPYRIFTKMLSQTSQRFLYILYCDLFEYHVVLPCGCLVLWLSCLVIGLSCDWLWLVSFSNYLCLYFVFTVSLPLPLSLPYFVLTVSLSLPLPLPLLLSLLLSLSLLLLLSLPCKDTQRFQRRPKIRDCSVLWLSSYSINLTLTPTLTPTPTLTLTLTPDPNPITNPNR
jgi:hypothetical protein